MRAEIYPSTDGWRFRIKGDNGEIMCIGEAYVRRRDAEGALKQLFNNESLEVTVRNHGTNVVDHYVLGRPKDDPAPEDTGAQ